MVNPSASPGQVLAENGKEDLLDGLAAIIYSFCARLYGQRRAKRKTEKITRELLESGT